MVIFSAGNRPTYLRQGGAPGPVSWPASNPHVISVSAINRLGGPSVNAPRGRIDLVAPTSDDVGPCYGDVLSLDRMGSPGCNDGPSGNVNRNSTFGGTSAAAPQVSGVLALLLAREPTLTVAQVRARLAAGADPWGRSDDFGAGKLNAAFTVLPFSAAISGPITIVQPGTYTWTANATGGSGQYTYAWAYRNWGSSTWIGLGGGSTVSRSIAANTSRFQFRLTVWSVNRTLQALYEVTVNAAGCSPLC